MNRFIYRIHDFDLLPGNKAAGFMLSVDAKALRELSHLSVTRPEQLAVMKRARERAQNAGLGNDTFREAMGIQFYAATPVPRFFSALSGSIGADPEAFPKLQKPGFVQSMAHGIEYTPHNVDAPMEALLLMLLVQTWGEWATDLLLFNTDKLEKLVPALEPIPDYGDVMTLEDFQSSHRAGALIPDDGSGYFATETGMSREDCFDEPPAWATHVVWFNR